MSDAAPMSVPGPRPWYREPYVWLVIAIPALAVLGGMAMIVIAVVSDDGLVVDDYYKRGKEINRVLERDRVAATLQLSAAFSIDARNVAAVELRSAVNAPLPQSVALNLAFATRAGIDQTVQLQRVSAAGRYAGELSRPLIDGRWHVQLQTERWRLVGTLRSPMAAPLELRVKR